MSSSQTSAHTIKVIRLSRAPKLAWAGPAYVAVCQSCRYRSKPLPYPGLAGQLGEAHAKAKNGEKRSDARKARY